MNLELVYKLISKVYDLLDVIYFRDYEKSPRKVVLESIAEQDRILDLCTGTATSSINIAKAKTSVEIIGIDLSNDMLKVAKNKVKRAGISNLKLYQMDATQLNFKSHSFDKVLISLILHELNEELAAKIIREAKRVLKDNGEIIITEWEPSQQLSKKILFAPLHYLEPKSYRKFIKKDLYSYFEGYGLKIQQYEHCDYTKVVVLKKTNFKSSCNEQKGEMD